MKELTEPHALFGCGADSLSLRLATAFIYVVLQGAIAAPCGMSTL
jgi:hypothetical protein